MINFRVYKNVYLNNDVRGVLKLHLKRVINLFYFWINFIHRFSTLYEQRNRMHVRFGATRTSDTMRINMAQCVHFCVGFWAMYKITHNDEGTSKCAMLLFFFFFFHNIFFFIKFIACDRRTRWFRSDIEVIKWEQLKLTLFKLLFCA